MRFTLKIIGLFAVCFCASAVHSVQAAEKVTVTQITGSPEIVRQGEAVPATVGMACQKNDTLKTTPTCSVDVAINQMAGCRVLPGTEMQIASADPNDMSLKVMDGNVILNLNKLPKNSTFKVETPTAIAAVRGTQFWGRVDGKTSQRAGEALKVTTFAVREGAVEISAKSTGQKFSLEKGQALDIPTGGALAVREALPEELQAMEQAPSIKTAD